MSVSALLHRKEQIEQDLRNVEKQIYDLEGSYLEDTCGHGNILQVYPWSSATARLKPQALPSVIRDGATS
jgi:chromatin modification-related protein EAF6